MKRKFDGEHEQRSRPHPYAQNTIRIRRSLAEIGEPGQSQDSTAIFDLVEDLSATVPEAWSLILEMVKALVVEQPHKVPLLALVFELTNQKRSAIAEAIVEMTHDEVTKAVEEVNYDRLKSFLRFVCCLRIAEHSAVVELLGDLLEKGEFRIPAISLVYLKYAGYKNTANLEASLSKYCERYTEKEPLAPFFGENPPYTAKPAKSYLIDAIKTSVESGWNLEFMPKLDSFAPREEDISPKHRFKHVQLPDAFVLEAPELTRTLLYLPQNEIETVPDPSSLFGVIIRDVASDIINNMDFNRKEVTRQLITLDLFFNANVFAPPATPFDTLGALKEDGAPTIKVEDIAVEAILEQLLQLPKTQFPIVYYDAVMIEACIMAPQAIAPVLGRAVRFLFANATSLDIDLFWRIVSWFAHHMSNFSFTWKWHEWSEFLELPKEHPKHVFMQQLIAKLVQLSYPQRVRDGLPDEFFTLVPDVPEVPQFRYAEDELVKRLLDDLNHSSASIDEIITDFKRELIQRHLGEDAVHAESSYANAVITVTCELGNRSTTHAANWITRISPAIKGSFSGSVIIEAVLEYWKSSPWVGLLVLDRFISAELIEPQALVEYIITHRELLLSTAGYERLMKYKTLTVEKLKLLSGESEWEKWWNERLRKVFQENDS